VIFYAKVIQDGSGRHAAFLAAYKWMAVSLLDHDHVMRRSTFEPIGHARAGAEAPGMGLPGFIGEF
jgi:hypothetical protein